MMVLPFKLPVWYSLSMYDIPNNLSLTHESLLNHINVHAPPWAEVFIKVSSHHREHTYTLLHRVYILLYTKPSCYLFYSRGTDCVFHMFFCSCLWCFFHNTTKSLSMPLSHAATHVFPLDQHTCYFTKLVSIVSTMPHLFYLTKCTIGSDTTIGEIQAGSSL